MTSKKSVLFISCDEAKHICDKVQYGEASGWERLKLNIRLSWCRITKAYSKRNNKLSELVQKAEVKTLDNDLKTKMKQELEKKLSSNN